MGCKAEDPEFLGGLERGLECSRRPAVRLQPQVFETAALRRRRFVLMDGG